VLPLSAKGERVGFLPARNRPGRSVGVWLDAGFAPPSLEVSGRRRRGTAMVRVRVRPAVRLAWAQRHARLRQGTRCAFGPGSGLTMCRSWPRASTPWSSLRSTSSATRAVRRRAAQPRDRLRRATGRAASPGMRRPKTRCRRRPPGTARHRRRWHPPGPNARTRAARSYARRQGARRRAWTLTGACSRVRLCRARPTWPALSASC
jgi:hypothetical protein